MRRTLLIAQTVHGKPFHTLQVRLGRFLATATGKWCLHVFNVVFTVGLVAYLALQLSRIGWSQVLGSVPTKPWFYLAFGAFYFTVPLYEGLALRLLWQCPLRRSFPALMKKRVYSRQLLDYSGEAYLYWWSKNNIDRPARELVHSLKDNIIISSTMSALVAVAAMLGLLLGGYVVLPAGMQYRATYLIAVATGLVVLLALTVKFRRRIFWLPRRTMAMLAGIHAARLVSLLVLQLLMWTTVDASVPLSSWLSLLSVELIIARIPFLPNRDLVLLGTGMQMAVAIQVELQVLAGMLLAASVLEKGLNLLFFGLFTAVSWPASRAGRVERHGTELLAAD